MHLFLSALILSNSYAKVEAAESVQDFCYFCGFYCIINWAHVGNFVVAVAVV